MDWVDRLRIWLTVLVVAHHTAYTYATISAWYVAEPGQDPSATALTVFLIVNQTYFMGMFFLLSGFFVPDSADRKGLGRFTRDRLVRLGAPILAYVVVIRPLCLIPAALYLSGRGASEGAVIHFLAFGGDPGVTWFLEVLLFFTIGYVLTRLAISHLRQASGGAKARTLRPGMLLTFAGVLATTTLAWHWITPPGTYWPVVGLPTPNFLPQYLLFFVAGVLASRAGWLDRLPGWYAIPSGLAVLIGAALYAPVVGKPVDIAHLHAGVATALGQTLFAVGAALLIILLFRTFLARPGGRLTRFLADQTLVVYITHPVVLVTAAVALHSVQAPAAAKAGLLFAIAAPLCWAVAWLLRRIRIVRAVA